LFHTCSFVFCCLWCGIHASWLNYIS
jgi:hypothetical protein